MADPHIESPMDWIDHLTVIIYRLGLTLAFPVIALLPWNLDLPIQEMVFVCAVMCASSLHIYSKMFRLLLQMATWIGLIFVVLGFPMIGLGGAFITLGGLCFKEYFCFRIPGLPLQPLLLASLWFCMLFNLTTEAKFIAVASSLLFLMVSIAKWRMPRHYDIGDKSKFEV